jgi:hypothetical protein
VDFFRARRARALGTRAHVRNIPSSVLPKSTVQNLGSSCTGFMFYQNNVFKPSTRTAVQGIPVYTRVLFFSTLYTHQLVLS